MFRSTLLRSWGPTACALLLLLAPRVAPAQETPSGSTLSPDLQSYMVNKDLATERWTITLNLYSTTPADIISITGNIFRPEGGPASFVTCLVREDSTGTLLDPNSVFRLSCSGADACETTAELCARDGWTPIADDVLVPASFFLPPNGNGSAAPQSARVESFLSSLIDRLAVAWRSLRDSQVARAGADLASPRSALAQVIGGRGATLTLDRLNHLVTKDIGDERWSISYTLEPFQTESAGVENRVLNVTGNVYQGVEPPSFVYCTVRDDSTGTLSDPTSEFRFRCLGADACTTTALECAQTGWGLISDDITLQASFFLPPDGLPASPQSDPDIIVIGRTSDPPSIGVEIAGNALAFRVDRPAGACPIGDACFVERIGACASVAGEVADVDDFDCACVVFDVPAECITCGSGAVGQCGGECEYAVNDETARGTCLPSNAQSADCQCYAIAAGEDLTTEGCGGVLGIDCPGDRCCANDPRGSCDPLGGQVPCPGVCVAADGCDPDVQQCGICMSPVGVPTATPTPVVTPTPTGGPTGTPTAVPTPTQTPTPPPPTPSPTPCIPAGSDTLCLGDPLECCSGSSCVFDEEAENFRCVPNVP